MAIYFDIRHFIKMGLYMRPISKLSIKSNTVYHNGLRGLD